MPLFSKAGCNTGACHGSASGKGNLKLSLRGESAADDFATLTKNTKSRRLNVDEPDASLLLRKPAELVEHEGGKRFAPESEEFRTLRAWIAGGATFDPPEAPALTGLTISPERGLFVEPQREVPLTATAHFSDGTTRDVTRQAVYESSNLLPKISAGGVVKVEKPGETTVVVRFEHLQTPVRLTFIPDRPDFVWDAPAPRNAVDEAVFAKLRDLRQLPSPVCDDATFARRVWLDLTGRLPDSADAQAFVSDPTPGKRDRLIDVLLDSPAFADHWTLKWADLLRVEERLLDTTGVSAFHGWIRQSVADDRPLDAFARAIVSEIGSTYQVPPANFYRALRDPTLRAEAVAQVFLGTRLGCAKCHNHPFERWTQDDYYRFSAIFDRIDYRIVKNERKDENDKMEFVGEQVVFLGDKRELKHPKTGQKPDPALLGENGQPLTDSNPLERLGAWMTQPDHPLFARVQANRIWSHLMGTGIVDPVDDFRLTNPPSNPALLDALTGYFVKNGMRAKPLIRVICQSHTWQASSTPLPQNADDSVNFSHPIVRRLPAETLLDAIHQALGTEPDFGSYPDTHSAAAVPGVKFMGRRAKPTVNDTFLKDFGKPPRTTVCACERNDESSLSQVFSLTSGPVLVKALAKADNALAPLCAPAVAPEEALRRLYWTILTRAPGAAEIERLSPLLADASARRPALEDIAWSLINSKEFLLRH